MDARTRQFVRDLLTKAHAGGLASVQTKLALLTEPDRAVAGRAIDAFREVMQRILESLIQPEDALVRIASLIHGHPNPEVVRLLKDYAEAVELLLVESRNRLNPSERSRDH